MSKTRFFDGGRCCFTCEVWHQYRIDDPKANPVDGCCAIGVEGAAIMRVCKRHVMATDEAVEARYAPFLRPKKESK